MSTNPDHFANRREAGQALARKLRERQFADPVVLALPRGGVPVGYEVARALDAPLDILLVRKIGAPGHEEYGIGALVDGAAPQIVIDQQAAAAVGADRAYLEAEVRRQLAEVERRRAAYRTGPPPALKGRTAIVVDDGVATGNTVHAALEALAHAEAAKIVLAVPVAAPDTLPRLRKLCDELVCLATPRPFHAVGAHYGDFAQTADAEVIALLQDANRAVATPDGHGDGAG